MDTLEARWGVWEWAGQGWAVSTVSIITGLQSVQPALHPSSHPPVMTCHLSPIPVFL